MIRKNVVKLFLLSITGLTSFSLVCACDNGPSSTEKEEVDEEDTFTTSSGYRYDETYHWKIDAKGQITKKSEHKFDEETHLCKTCGVSNGGDDFQWEFGSNGTVVITKYSGTYPHLVLSKISTENGYTLSISEIAANAFQYNPVLESVCIGSSVMKIEDNAFQYCYNLKSVTLNNKNATFGRTPFYYCENLKAINYIGGDINDWLNMSFYSEAYSGGPFYTYDDAFVSLYFNWEIVNDIVIPDNIGSIPCYAFSGFSSIKSVTIPKSVTEICTMAFYRCPKLNDVYYLGSLDDWLNLFLGENYVSRGRDTTVYHYYAAESNPCCNGANLYINGELLTELILDKSYQDKIPDGIFAGVTSLEIVRISSDITSFGENVFEEAFIDEIHYEGTLEEWISFAKSSGSIGWFVDHFYTNDGLIEGDYVIPSSITEVGDQSFYGLLNLHSVFIPSSVTSLGSECFFGCTNLESVVFEEGSQVKNIPFAAFYGCLSLKSIVVPSRVTYFGSISFEFDYELDTIYYCGTTQEAFDKISFDDGYSSDIMYVPGDTRYAIKNATLYLYSESQPITAGNYWHYVQNFPVAW